MWDRPLEAMEAFLVQLLEEQRGLAMQELDLQDPMLPFRPSKQLTVVSTGHSVLTAYKSHSYMGHSSGLQQISRDLFVDQLLVVGEVEEERIRQEVEEAYLRQKQDELVHKPVEAE